MNQIVSREKEASHRLKRIYIDSKYRASGNSNQFTVSLPESLEMSHNHVFMIDDVCIPRSWYVVNSNNNFVYLLWSDSGAIRLRRAALELGDYDGNTLAVALAAALNTLGRGTFTVSFSTKTARLTVSNPTTPFILPTDAELVNLGLIQAFNIANNIADSNFDVPQVYADDLSKQRHKSINYAAGNFIKADLGTIKVLQPINLNNIDTLYIHASGMGSYNTVNLRGEPTIIKEVKISGAPFDYIFDNANQFDWLDCSHQTWSNISFWITDKNGHLIDLNDRDVSFSIVLNDLTLV